MTKTTFYLACLMGLAVIGKAVADDPQNSILRALLYTLALCMVVSLVYHFLGPVFGVGEEDDAPLRKSPASSDEQKDTVSKGDASETVSVRLIVRTISHIKSGIQPEVHAEIAAKVRRAAKGDIALMLALGQGFLFGDSYLMRDGKIAMEWLAHAARRDNGDAADLLQLALQSDKHGRLPEMDKKPKSYISATPPIPPIQHIDDMIGLANVKKQVKGLLNRQTFEALRRDSGLPSESDFNLHLVFTGNPGTGKTAVANRLGAILAEAGILKTGTVVECSGSDLIGEYVGTTAPRVEEVVKRAIGGILFIDEAYSLISHVGANGKQSSASMTAVTTLLLQMSKHNGKFMVIAAGYPDEMKDFLEFNPGLKSRFRETLHFPNFTTEELVQIFEKIAADRHYILAEGSKAVLEKIMHSAPGKFAKSFGNARFVGNLFEETLERVANRVAQQKEPSREDLTTITPFDINDAAADFMRQHNR